MLKTENRFTACGEKSRVKLLLITKKYANLKVYTKRTEKPGFASVIKKM